MARHERVTGNAKDGWSDWISPIMKRYMMSCCDCGLVHQLRFQVVKITRYLGRGRWRAKKVAGFRVQLQARRHERATASARRPRCHCDERLDSQLTCLLHGKENRRRVAAQLRDIKPGRSPWTGPR